MQYLRVTVIGTRRKADLALPDDHPLEDLLPEIVDLLDEPATGGAPLVLTTLLGVPVDLGTSLTGQDIDNGTVLRLLPLDSAPQPPDVAEVTEAVADAAVARPDRWNGTLTAIVLGAVVALVAAVSAAALAPVTGPSTPALVFALAVVAGAALTRRGNTAASCALFGLSAGVAFPLARALVASWAATDASLAAATALAWVLLWVAAAVVFGLGAGRRGVVLGAAVAVLTGAVVVVTGLLSAPVPTVVAFSGVVAAAALGIAPSFALTAAGVTRFDDAVIDGEAVRRSDVSAAITEAFSTQTFLVLALAAPLTTSILLLLGGNAWEQGLAAALAVFVLVRARLFPLAVARVALLLTALIPALTWLATTDALSAGWRAGVGAVVCAVLVLATLPRPSAATGARLRRALGLVEALSVIAMVPLILGLLGVFGDLLGAFS